MDDWSLQKGLVTCLVWYVVPVILISQIRASTPVLIMLSVTITTIATCVLVGFSRMAFRLLTSSDRRSLRRNNEPFDLP